MRLFQGDGSEEGGWYLHNAVRHDDVLFHPECHKDMDKVGQVDTSVDTTIETMDTTETEQKVDLDESIGNILERVEEEDVGMKPDVKAKVPDVGPGRCAQQQRGVPGAQLGIHR